MSSKAIKPPKAPADPRIYIPREKLSRVLTMTPPTDEQRSVLVTGMSGKFPSVYEMFPTEEVKRVLRELDIVWSDKK